MASADRQRSRVAAARETIAASLVLVRVGMNGEGKGKHGAGLEIFLKG
jgi:hypothetical protein